MRNPCTTRRPVHWWMLVALAAICGFTGVSQDYFIFTSFRGNGEDGLHLALSTNGYDWRALHRDQSFLHSDLGAKLIRDPCLATGPDGVFHMVWTCGWTSKEGRIIGYASSTNLLSWSVPRAIHLMETEPTTRNLWAPEIFYEQHQHRWLIFWSSTIPGRFPDSDQTGDDRYNHRFYCCTTTDFDQFGPCRLMYDPGFNIIDGTMMSVDDRFYLFFKDERKNPKKKNLRYALANHPEGPYSQPSEPFTGDWVEGPSAIKIGPEYLVYFDHYAAPAYYGAVRSRDLLHWEDCSREMHFPPGMRHGTVVRVDPQIARTLMATE